MEKDVNVAVFDPATDLDVRSYLFAPSVDLRVLIFPVGLVMVGIRRMVLFLSFWT